MFNITWCNCSTVVLAWGFLTDVKTVLISKSFSKVLKSRLNSEPLSNTNLLNYFDIKPVLTSVRNPQANAQVERLHKVILNMLVTNYIDNKVFNYIYPWGETLASIAWLIRASCHRTIMSTPCQAVFGRDILFNLASVVDWLVVTAAKQRQVDIDNVRENSKQVTHDYAIGDQVYVEITCI